MWKLLRALNLLEPGRHVVSLTKLMVWEAIVGVPVLAWWLVTTSPGDAGSALASVAAALAPAVPVGGLYAYRRYDQRVRGVSPGPDSNPEGM